MGAGKGKGEAEGGEAMSGGIYHFAPSYDPEQSRADHERLLQALAAAAAVEAESKNRTVRPADLPEPKPQRRQRKPSLAAALKQANNAGKPVKAATIGTEGVKLEFGEPEDDKSANAYDDWIAKHAN